MGRAGKGTTTLLILLMLILSHLLGASWLVWSLVCWWNFDAWVVVSFFFIKLFHLFIGLFLVPVCLGCLIFFSPTIHIFQKKSPLLSKEVNFFLFLLVYFSDTNQALRLCLGNKTTGAEFGAISALSINHDCSRLLCGFAKGQVNTFFWKLLECWLNEELIKMNLFGRAWCSTIVLCLALKTEQMY